MSGKRLVIVGGVAADASAASRARWLCEKCNIIVFELAGVGLIYVAVRSKAGA